MATSEVSICNEALISLGEDTIISLTDNTKRARTCNALYASKRDSLLRSHPWKFAIRRVSLAADAATPLNEFDAQFSLPSDCLRFLDIYPGSGQVPYRLEGQKILASESELEIKYIQQITDVTKMDMSFREALSALMAREMVVPLVNSDSKLRAMAELFEMKIGEARFVGAIEDDLYTIEAEEWLLARE